MYVIKILVIFGFLGFNLTFSNLKQESLDHELIEAVSNNDLTFVKSLIAQGADINTSYSKESINYSENTPLIIAAESGRYDIVKLLIGLGVDTNKTNKYGETPLYYALGDEKIATLLLENQADPNVRPGGGLSLFSIAVRNSNEKIASLLINYKADINGKGKVPKGEVRTNWFDNKLSDGPIPLSIAIQNNNLDMVNFLIKNGADVNLLEGTKSPLSMAKDQVRLLKEESNKKDAGIRNLEENINNAIKIESLLESAGAKNMAYKVSLASIKTIGKKVIMYLGWSMYVIMDEVRKLFKAFF